MDPPPAAILPEPEVEVPDLPPPPVDARGRSLPTRRVTDSPEVTPGSRGHSLPHIFKFWTPDRKKSVTDVKAPRRSTKRSPLVAKRSTTSGGDMSGTTSSSTSSGSTSTTRHRTNTSEGQPSTSAAVSDGHQSQDDSETTLYDEADSYLCLAAGTNGGGGNWSGAEDADLHDGGAVDPARTKAAIEQLQVKMHRTMEMIRSEQKAKEENVNEYLRLSANADKQQQQRIKTVFEKKNQKSTQSISQLQRKLENYQKKLKDVEMYGVTGHKQAKDVLKDMGQGLKDVGANIREGLTGFSGGVVDNIRGAKETIVSKPKEFAHLIKNKFGSADNITNLKQYEDGQGSTTDDGEKYSTHGSGTLPARCGESTFYTYTPASSFKYQSDDETSSVTSGSGPSGAHSSPRPQVQQSTAPGSLPHIQSQDGIQHIDLEPIMKELSYQREANIKLQQTIDNLKSTMMADHSLFKRAIEEERFRCERLEEQINDLTELHQHEVTNIKQELSSMEEKMEYQLEERTRDMQDLLETCQTRITKMELQQQQQQLISMEGIENSNFRALLTKLINVVLALLAVILVFVSTVANMLGPFLTTRVRILSTICLVACIVATWQNWGLVRSLGNHVVTKYRQLLPFQ